MKRPIFVAELTINHLGMQKIAKAMISAAKESGADYIKLKIKKVEKYYDKEVKKWRDFEFIDYRKSLELYNDDFLELNNFCKEIGIGWFSTLHDSETFQFIKKLDPPMYKIASMDSDKEELVDEVIEACRQDNKPLVLSLGGKDEEFTEAIVGKIKKNKIKAYILHTVSIYPTPIGRCNINYIPQLISKYQDDNIKIGYSGHEEGIAPTILASIYGAAMIERHFTLSKDYLIHHIKTAITPLEFKEMVKMVDEILEEKSSTHLVMDKEELEFLKDIKYK